IIGPARLVGAELARPLRLAGRLGVAHLAVFRHVGGRRFRGFGGVLRQVFGRGLALLHAGLLHVVGVGRLALLPLFLLAALLLAFVLLLLGLGSAVLAHVERIEQVAHGVGEQTLVL